MKKYMLLSVLCFLSSFSRVAYAASSHQLGSLAVLAGCAAGGASCGYKAAPQFNIQNSAAELGLITVGAGWAAGMTGLLCVEKKGFVLPVAVSVLAMKVVSDTNQRTKHAAVVGGAAGLLAALLAVNKISGEPTNSVSGWASAGTLVFATLAAAKYAQQVAASAQLQS